VDRWARQVLYTRSRVRRVRFVTGVVPTSAARGLNNDVELVTALGRWRRPSVPASVLVLAAVCVSGKRWSGAGCLGVRVSAYALPVAVFEDGGAEDAELVKGEHGDQLEECGDGVAAGE
jgi:hypothetical protein